MDGQTGLLLLYSVNFSLFLIFPFRMRFSGWRNVLVSFSDMLEEMILTGIVTIIDRGIKCFVLLLVNDLQNHVL